MNDDKWLFDDPPSLAAFTSKQILEGEDWIHYVAHDDYDDETWQFHGYSGPTSEEDARIVALSNIVSRDQTITELRDLPLGWCAWRETKQSEWQRKNAKKMNTTSIIKIK